MTDVMDRNETDVRERILVTAERLFPGIGYQKTTVADIAKALHMSPANVYRFFDSKKSITAGVARRLMGEVEQASQVIVRKPGGAAARLRQLLETMHRMNRERYAGVTADVIGDGVASGEFHAPDIGGAALCVLTAMLRFIHPQFIAEFAHKPTATFDQMIDFVITALSAPGHPPVA
jgi:AcrR family transcriptional regulator